MRSVATGANGAVAVVAEVLSWWLCHGRNISNPAIKYVLPEPLDRVRVQIGAEDWADTDGHLSRLLERQRATKL